MSPRKSLLILSILVLSSMFSMNEVSAKVPTIITEDFESTIVGLVDSRGTNYTEVQSSVNGTVWADPSNSSDIPIGQQVWSGNYIVSRNFYRLDTRAIPLDAEIQSAILRVDGGVGGGGSDPQTIRIRKWTDGNDGLGLDDYSMFDAINYDDGTTTRDNWVINGNTNNMTISNFTLIQKGDYTDVCLRGSREIDMITPDGFEYVLVSSELTSVTITVSYVISTGAEGKVRPIPPWERVPAFISQLVRDHVTTPFWNMWIEMNITFAGILASIVVVIFAYMGLECYRWIRKPRKKLKIAKIRFS